MIALLKKFVNSTIGTANAKPLDAIVGEVQTTATSIKATNLINYGSAVKSVQSGTTSAISGIANTVAIPVSTVNPLKCIVLLNGYAVSLSTYTGQPIKNALTSTQLTIGVSAISATGSTAISTNFGWQLIEYY